MPSARAAFSMDAVATAVETKPKLVFSEILRFAYETFCADKVRFVLTALGMVIGTASLILVVTIGLTGKQYILSQIQAIGANLIYTYYEGGAAEGQATANDYLTVEDMYAVQRDVPGIRAASPMLQFQDRTVVPGGRVREIMVLGVSPSYREVRNLLVLAGRFFDEDDTLARNKVALLTERLAQQLYGSQDAAVGRELKIGGPTIRAAIAIARILVHRHAQARVDDPVFQWVCRDVLSTETAKVTRDGQSLMPHEIDEAMTKICGALKRPRRINNRPTAGNDEKE